MSFRFCLFAAALLLAAGHAHAHHSHSSLDRDNVQRYTGVISKVSWRMPHVFLEIRGPNEQGELVDWVVELLHPAGMVSRGWNQNSLQVGERIVWEGARDKNPQRYYTGMFWAEKADGTRLINWGDGVEVERPPIEPSTDFTGMWMRDSDRVGFSYFPPENWPYTPAAQLAVDNFDETQNPQFSCIDPGPPKSTLLPYPVRISKPDENTFVLDYDMRDQRRVFRLGETPEPGPASKTGQSRAWMEGEELVVETTNFVPDRWGIQTGVDSSADKHLVERFSLIDEGLTLRVQMTVTDPAAFTEPVHIDYYMNKIADRETLPESCNIESARLFIEAGYQESGSTP